jgi:hypothetical protein
MKTIESRFKSLKKVGRGAFSDVRMLEDGYVVAKSVDQVKECMAAGWFPEHGLVPAVELLDTSLDGEHCFYKIEYYPKERSLKNSLKEHEYALYKELRRIFSEFIVPMNRHDLYSQWYTAFEGISDEFEEQREEIIEGFYRSLGVSSDRNIGLLFFRAERTLIHVEHVIMRHDDSDAWSYSHSAFGIQDSCVKDRWSRKDVRFEERDLPNYRTQLIEDDRRINDYFYINQLEVCPF